MAGVSFDELIHSVDLFECLCMFAFEMMQKYARAMKPSNQPTYKPTPTQWKIYTVRQVFEARTQAGME